MVVNGDDFGFSSGVNRAIIDAHDRGILTSTSLMVTGDAFEEAVELAKKRPNLAVGLHLVLTCGRSVLPASQIPHLVDDCGNFSNQPNLTGWRYQFSRAAQQEIPLEIRAQLEKFYQTGLPLSHVDGHLHLHLHPVVLRHLVKLAPTFQIRFIRLPWEELNITLEVDRSDLWTKLVWFCVFTGLCRYGKRLLKANGIQSVDRVYGLLQSGRMTEDYLLKLIPKIQAERVEIYSHPAIAIAEEPSNAPLGLGPAELEALLSDRVRELLKQQGFTLTNYSEQRIAIDASLPAQP
jgi:hopanoid biosynthesis associated protein HpnK